MIEAAGPAHRTRAIASRGGLRYWVQVICFLMLAAILPISSPAQAQSTAVNGEKIFGLLVINQSYQDGFSPLTSVESNLSGAYRLFQTLNVPVQNVKLLLGGGPSEIEDALFALGDSMPEDAQLIVYYYGLGLTATADGANLAILPDLNLRETSEARLVRRRLLRSTLPLQTLARDLGFTPARQKLIIYDACANPALTGGDDAGYWAEIERSPCNPQPISGADVIFGVEGIGQSALLDAVTEVLSRDPKQTLTSLQVNLQTELETNFGLPQGGAVLVHGDTTAEITGRCLYSADPEAGVCSADPALEPAERSKEEVTAEAPSAETQGEVPVDPATTETDKTDDTNASSDSQGSTANATSEQTQEPIPRGDAGNAQEVQTDWSTAKATNSCGGYSDFILKHPRSAFALKAQFSQRRVCSAEEIAAFEVVKQEAAEAAKQDQEPIVVAETTPEVDAGDSPSEDVPSAAEPEPKAPAPTVANSVNVRQAWLDAKAEDSCEAYLSFEHDNPGSPFALKAKFASDRACTPEQRAAFLVTKAETDADTGAKPQEEDTTQTDAGRENANGTEQPETPIETATDETAEEDPVTSAEAEPEDTTVTSTEPQPTTAPDEPVADTEDAGTDTDDARAEPAVPLTDREAWQVAQTENSCLVYLDFAENYPSSFLSLRADLAARSTCSETQKIAYSVGKLNADGTIGGRKEPRPQAEETTETQPEPKVADTPPVEEISPTEPETAEATETPRAVGERKKAYAFAIVNDDYTGEGIPDLLADPDLEIFENIAKEVGIPPERIRVLRNADRVFIEEEAFSFALEMDPGSDLLVYYFGHSLSMLGSKDQVILPSSFEIPATRQVRLSRRRVSESTLRLRDLIRDLREGQPGRVTLIYNGCGKIPLTGGEFEPYWEFTNRNVCDSAPISGVSVMFPVKPDQYSGFDATEENGDPSPFMQVMYDTLKKNPFIGLSELSRTLAWEVPQFIPANRPKEIPVLLNDPDLLQADLEGRCLVPMLLDGTEHCANLEGQIELPIEEDPSSSKTDDEVVEPADTAADEPATPEPADAEDTEDTPVRDARTAWFNARAANSCDAIRAFQQEYPDSEFSDLADLRLDALCADEGSPTEDEEPVDVADLPEYCVEGSDDINTAPLAREGFRLVQQRLNDLGCNVGGADGVWGRNSQRGFVLFVKESGVSWSETNPVCGTVARMQAHPDGRVCPLVCGGGFRKEGDRCVRIPQANTTTSTTRTTTTTTSPARTTTNTAPAPAAKTAKCGPLQRRSSNGSCVALSVGVFR